MTVTPFPSPTEKPSRFDELFKLWPRREKKALAKIKYEAILRGLKTKTLDRDSGMFVDLELTATEEEILTGAKAYVKSMIDTRTYKIKDDGKYVPYLCQFLNQGRWIDYL